MSDDEQYAQALTELETRNVARDIWAQAVSKTDGNPEKANACYITLRVAQLRQQTPLLPPATSPYTTQNTQNTQNTPQSTQQQVEQAAPAYPPEDIPAVLTLADNRRPLPILPIVLIGITLLAIAIGVAKFFGANDSPPERIVSTPSPDASAPLSSPGTTEVAQALARARREQHTPQDSPQPPAYSASRPITQQPAIPILAPRKLSQSPLFTQTAEEMILLYPYLALPDNNPWLESVIIWRDAYINILRLPPHQALQRASHVVGRYRIQGYGVCMPDTSSAQNLAVDSARHCRPSH